MAASVFQDRGLKKPMQSMAAQTDVEMGKEEPGQTMSTGLQVLRPPCYVSVLSVTKYYCYMYANRVTE